MTRPIEANWLDLYRAAVAAPGYPSNVENYQMLALNPGIRQSRYGATGTAFIVPLSALSTITLSLSAPELARVPAEESRIASLKLPDTVVLQIGDGATVPTVNGTSKIRLQAHRNLATSLVPVALHWPRLRIDLWRFFSFINYGTSAEREAALKGEL